MTQKRNYREEVQVIKRKYMFGEITYNEAKEQVAPILVDMNVIMARVCKENKMRFKPLTFAYVFR